MDKVFDGKRIVLGDSQTVGGKTFDVDLKLHRNHKMTEVLQKEGVNGVFMFYLDKTNEKDMKGFMMPPGLSEKHASEFQKKFLTLLEKYAGLAKK